MVIIDAGLPEAERHALIERIRKMITDLKGKLVQEEDWGKRRFAYPIRHKTEGYYFIFYFWGDNELLEESKRTMLMIEDILRFKTMRRDDISERLTEMPEENAGKAVSATE